MAHVAEYKKDIVKQLVETMKQYPIIGIVNMENLPAQQLQHMRENLRDKVTIIMTKKRLMRIAFKESGIPGIETLEKYFRGMPALLFTRDNPFTLFAILKKNKSAAPAKAGQTAVKDIVVKAGATPFSPGPIIGELGAFGIKTGVEGGKVAVKDDKVVCKEGEVISGPLAGILTRLGVKPMEVGLDLIAIYEEGTIFEKSVLDVDEDEFRNKFATAASDAFALSLEIGYVTPENILALLTKASREAHALGMEAAIINKDNAEQLLARAYVQGEAVKAKTEA